MKLIWKSGHWEDERGNTFTRMTAHEAAVQRNSLINCSRCQDCKGCTNCVKCVNCTDCEDCVGLDGVKDQISGVKRGVTINKQGAFVGSGATIGECVTIYRPVYIDDGVTIGDHAMLMGGAAIFCDIPAWGFVPNNEYATSCEVTDDSEGCCSFVNGSFAGKWDKGESPKPLKIHGNN